MIYFLALMVNSRLFYFVKISLYSCKKKASNTIQKYVCIPQLFHTLWFHEKKSCPIEKRPMVKMTSVSRFSSAWANQRASQCQRSSGWLACGVSLGSSKSPCPFRFRRRSLASFRRGCPNSSRPQKAAFNEPRRRPRPRQSPAKRWSFRSQSAFSIFFQSSRFVQSERRLLFRVSIQ